jgi:hypothetical protein
MKQNIDTPLNQPPGDSLTAQTDRVAHVQQLPVIRSSSGTVLTDTQTHKNVYPKRYRVTYIREVPTALDLEEQSHAASREAANTIIEALRDQVATLEAEKATIENDWAELLSQMAIPATVPPMPTNQRAQDLLVQMKALDDEANRLSAENVDLRTDNIDLRAELDKVNQQLRELQSRPSEASLTKSVHDDLTLTYLREWFKTLSPEEKAQQDHLIREIVKPWHERGTVWNGVYFRARGPQTGQTPYEASPPTKVHQGQGAIQPHKPAA